MTVSDNDFLDLQDRFNTLKLTVDTLLLNLLNPALITPGTLRFGGNVMQLDHEGIQIKADTASTTVISFTKSLVTQPGAQTTRAQISSQVSDTAVNMSFAAARATGNLVQLYMTEAAATGSVAQFIGSTSMAIQLFPGGDPPSPADGYIWYNDTANKLYAYINGATVELGAGGSSMGIVTIPAEWQSGAGYEFWLIAGSADPFTASSATNISGLDSYGWTITSLAFTGGGTGDFLSTADNDPARVVTNASADSLASPVVFGSGAHSAMAEQLLGAAPTTLSAEFYACFSTASANETSSFLGFAAAGDADAAAGSCVGAIVSDGTNFRLRSASGNDAGAAIDTGWHKWKITIGASTTEWFIDDVSQGTITTSTDLFPTCFRMRAGTTNRPELAWVRVFYA